MIVMPTNATGWFLHSLARETGRLGHLFSPGAQRGPWPWFPYALDNGAFACWDSSTNTFDYARWERTEKAWMELLEWARSQAFTCRWAIVPDIPGNAKATIERWLTFAPVVQHFGIPLAVAAQDGMTESDVRALRPEPAVVAIGGTTGWKWSTAQAWCKAFPRVHVLRCNSPTRLYELEAWGCESTDGTGWNRGCQKQTSGLEEWARSKPQPMTDMPLWPHVCRGRRRGTKT